MTRATTIGTRMTPALSFRSSSSSSLHVAVVIVMRAPRRLMKALPTTLIVLMLLLLQHGVIVAVVATTTTPTSRTTTITSSSLSSSSSTAVLDLSYLHRTPVSYLKHAIQQQMTQTQQQQRRQKSQCLKEVDSSKQPQSSSSTSSSLVIDLTASLIGKNASEIVSVLTRRDSDSLPKQEVSESRVGEESSSEARPGSGQSSELVISSTQTATTSPSTPIELHLIVRQNHWVPADITMFLKSLFDVDGDVDDDDEDHDNQNNQHENQSPVDTTTDSIAAAAACDDEALLNGDISNTTSSNIVVVTDTVDTNKTSDINNATARRQQDVPPTSPFHKPAFFRRHVIKNLDLGWNSMCISDRVESLSSSNPGSSSTTSRLHAKKIRNDKKALKEMNQQLQRIVENRRSGPTTIRLDVCGLGPSTCRSIAKGIVNRYCRLEDGNSNMSSNYSINSNNRNSTTASQDQMLPPPLSLYMARNDGMGDPGVVALSAAVRTVATKLRQRNSSKALKEPYTADSMSFLSSSPSDGRTTHVEDIVVLDVLDLSGCAISDVGAKALAISLERNPFCIRHLDLSNNQISNEGAKAIANALSRDDGGGKVTSLDLSYNTAIDDQGAKALASAVGTGGVKSLTLRSCGIHADGASAFGAALRVLVSSRSYDASNAVSVDLSGNPLGLLRKKPKSKSKFSTKEFTSKATATTAAYMNLIGKTVQKGLKDLGLDDSPETLESDDEEESKMGFQQDEEESKMKCGALAFAEAFVSGDDDNDDPDHDNYNDNESKTPNSQSKLKSSDTPLHVYLGLRHCSFDTRAADALAAILLEAQNQLKIDLEIDATMNHVLEDDVVNALRGDRRRVGGVNTTTSFSSFLSEMSERYHDAQDILRESRQRAADASRIAAARSKTDSQLNAALGKVHGDDEDDWDDCADHNYEGERLMDEYQMDEEGGWDSDAAYEWDGGGGDDDEVDY